MFYNQPFQAQPYYGQQMQPMADQLTQLRQGPQMAYQPQSPSGGITWVQGEEAAKAYMVAAGGSVLLMDSEHPSFYIKSTAPSGMPMPLRIFDYVERTAAKQQTQAPGMDYVTRQELAALEAKLEAFAAMVDRPIPIKKIKKEESDNAQLSV